MSTVRRKLERIAFVASDNLEAMQARDRLIARYGNFTSTDPDLIVALGGDGLMLQTLHRHMGRPIPIYGMNRGSVGFLMNEYREDALVERLERAEMNRIRPLAMHAVDAAGIAHDGVAINEVSLFRQTHQAAKLRIAVDGTVRLEQLNGDGVLVSTPAGSSAYNFSAGGPIVPIDARLLALTPISPFRPRRWRGALLTNKARITIDVLEPEKRPVSAVADHSEIRSVVRVAIAEHPTLELHLLFDQGHNLDERILAEQFGY